MTEIKIKELFRQTKAYAIKNRVDITTKPHVIITYKPTLADEKFRFGTITKPGDPISVSKLINGYYIKKESIKPDNPIYNEFITYENMLIYDDEEMLMKIPDDSYWQYTDNSSIFWFKDEKWYIMNSKNYYVCDDDTMVPKDKSEYITELKDIVKNILINACVDTAKFIRVTPVQCNDEAILKHYNDTELNIDKIKDEIIPLSKNPLVGMRYNKTHKEHDTGYYIFDIMVRETIQSDTWYDTEEEKIINIANIKQFTEYTLNRPGLVFPGELRYIWLDKSEPIAVVNPADNTSEIVPLIYDKNVPIIYVNEDWVPLRNTKYANYELYKTRFVKL